MAQDAFDSKIGSKAHSMNLVLLAANHPLSLDEIMNEVRRRGLPVTDAPREHLSRLEGKDPKRPLQYVKKIAGDPDRWVRCSLNTPRIWKIAPGDHAEDWHTFSKLGCVGIGWLEDRDFSDFRNVDAVLSALVQKYGKRKSGYGSGAADMIWSFVHELACGDVVVANDAYNRSVGIGIVESHYLSPASTKNPLRKDITTHRHHARLVNWVVKKPAEIPGNRLFEQKTIATLDDSKVATIHQSYLDQHPGDPTLASQLNRLFGKVSSPPTPEGGDMGDVKPARAASTIYRILRDTELARRVKVMHNYECQVCGETIDLLGGNRYAEAHHIQPLGTPHDGPDVIDNILCLCPNHHAQCDLGAIKLSLENLRTAQWHTASERYLDYHNNQIYLKRVGKLPPNETN